MSLDQGSTESVPQPHQSGDTNSSSQGQGAVLNQGFTLFKDYLENQLENKSKEIEKKSKIDKQVEQLKFKGNQKQLELKAKVDSILESLEVESQ